MMGSNIMTSNAEIWKCASLLIEKYGEMALNGAALKADELERKGDREGRVLWLKVTEAVEQLLSEDVPANVTRH